MPLKRRWTALLALMLMAVAMAGCADDADPEEVREAPDEGALDETRSPPLAPDVPDEEPEPVEEPAAAEGATPAWILVAEQPYRCDDETLELAATAPPCEEYVLAEQGPAVAEAALEEHEPSAEGRLVVSGYEYTCDDLIAFAQDEPCETYELWEVAEDFPSGQEALQEPE